MQDHRNDGGEQAPRPANPSRPLGSVHGLGESHALRVDLQPVQLPWLADEIDTLRAIIREEHERAVNRHDELPPSARRGEAEAEVHRRAYQLRVLAMIREQLPLSSAVVAASIASPWEEHNELAWELARITAPVTVVGPARAMLVLVRGPARNVADALGEALRGPRSEPRAASASPALEWPEWTRTTTPLPVGCATSPRRQRRSPTPTSAPYCSSPTASTPTTIRCCPTSSGSGRPRQRSASCQRLWSAGVGGPLPDLWASLWIVGPTNPSFGTVSVRVNRPERRAFFTPKSLAAYLALSERTVREMLRRGALPSYRVGGARRIDPSDVDSYLAGRREEGVA